MWENLGLSEKVILGSIGLEFGSVLYIQDEGNKELNKVYIDKNSGIMYKCIKTTSIQSNTEEYFSRIDIGNIYDRFGIIYPFYYRRGYTDDNTEVMKPYEDMVSLVVSDVAYPSKINYCNGAISHVGNTLQVKLTLGIDFISSILDVSQRPTIPNDNPFIFNFSLKKIMELFKCSHLIINSVSGRNMCSTVLYTTHRNISTEMNDMPAQLGHQIIVDKDRIHLEFEEIDTSDMTHANNTANINIIFLTVSFIVSVK